jgi:glycogen phosphorylase
VLDGWWDEGYEGDNGWAIGTREIDPDEAAQDWRDAQDLYRILEEQIVPAYYERDADGLPQGWLKVMRRAMASALWRFSSTRMLHEYTEHLYLPKSDASADELAPDAAASAEHMAVADAAIDDLAPDAAASAVGTETS